MLDLLAEYLNKATSPEEKLEIERACQVLDRIGVDDYEYVFEDILSTDDEVDAGTTLFEIVKYTRAHLYNVLQQHTIIASADATTTNLSDFVQGIINLDNYENKQELLALCNSSASTQDVFASLMSLVTKYTVDEIAILIDSVSDAFISKLKNNQTVIEHEDEVLAVDRREHIRALKQYITFIDLLGGIPNTEALIRRGVDVGLPYTLYVGQMTHIFTSLKPVQIARELYGVAIACGDRNGTHADLIKQHLEQYTSDAEQISAIMGAVNQLSTQYTS